MLGSRVNGQRPLGVGCSDQGVFLDLREIAISGQCLPAMGRVKILRVVGQLGYCIANPMISGRARISALIGVCRNARWIPEIEGGHEQPGGIPSFCQRVCRQQRLQSTHLKVGNPTERNNKPTSSVW
jgi:hypothetical protein